MPCGGIDDLTRQRPACTSPICEFVDVERKHPAFCMVSHYLYVGGILWRDNDGRHGGAVHTVFALGIFIKRNSSRRLKKVSGVFTPRIEIQSRSGKKSFGELILERNVIAEKVLASFERNAARHLSGGGERRIHELELAVVLSYMEDPA